MMDGIVLTNDVDCFDLCDILRLKLTGYVDNVKMTTYWWKMVTLFVWWSCMCR